LSLKQMLDAIEDALKLCEEFGGHYRMEGRFLVESKF
jgi:hypothetical protein